ncbi:MAG: PilN domain-containing protein [Methylovulum sp.]|nr:PilN domain-containing protein [Methylovulum sp.]
MAKINLLPWREELRKQKRQDFLNTIILAALLTVLVFGSVHLYINGEKEYQEKRNKLLQDEIALLDKKITAIKTIEEKKSKLLAKIDVIKKLQESRPEIVHLFDEIPKLTPDGVYLKKFTQLGTDLVFEGKSESNARVSAFMKSIEGSQWLKMPKLDVIKAPEKTELEQSSDFTLYAKQGGKDDVQVVPPVIKRGK